METRTEKEWRSLHEKCILAIVQGYCSNYYFSDISLDTLADYGIRGADTIVEKLKKREKENAKKNG